MTKTMLLYVALLAIIGVIMAGAGYVLKREKLMAYGVATIGAGVLLFCYDIVALAF